MEWVAISFSSAWKWKVKEKSLSRVRLFATPWTAAYQAPLSVGYSRQEYWSGVPSPSPKKYLTQVIIFTAFNVCWTNTQCIQRNENTVGNMPTCHHHAQTGRNSSWEQSDIRSCHTQKLLNCREKWPGKEVITMVLDFLLTTKKGWLMKLKLQKLMRKLSYYLMVSKKKESIG